jgi:hypothetical protein
MVLSGAAVAQLAGATAITGEKMKQPNIVLILVDDMGYSDIGCYGSEIQTPNLDRMAGEGVRFTQFYNGARCCPTRASLLTGLYAHQAGVGHMIGNEGPGPYQGFLNDSCVTIAEVLKGGGYATYMSGKWHVGEDRPHWPVDRGFDRHYGLISGAMNYLISPRTRVRSQSAFSRTRISQSLLPVMDSTLRMPSRTLPAGVSMNTKRRIVHSSCILPTRRRTGLCMLCRRTLLSIAESIWTDGASSGRSGTAGW